MDRHTQPMHDLGRWFARRARSLSRLSRWIDAALVAASEAEIRRPAGSRMHRGSDPA